MFEADRGRVRAPGWARGQPLGSVVIAHETAAAQAREFGHSLRAEIARLLVHGVVHLAGYDHDRSAHDERLMFRVEDRILARLTRVIK
jgi:probable rRNA maturation factor